MTRRRPPTTRCPLWHPAADGCRRHRAPGNGTRAGKVYPALTVERHATLAEFDRQNPEGADYVIVPAIGSARAVTFSHGRADSDAPRHPGHPRSIATDWPPEHLLPTIGHERPARAFDEALRGISGRYGIRTSRFRGHAARIPGQAHRNDPESNRIACQNVPFSFGESFEIGCPKSHSSTMLSCSNRKMCTAPADGSYRHTAKGQRRSQSVQRATAHRRFVPGHASDARAARGSSFMRGGHSE